jgi:hypothetical protein
VERSDLDALIDGIALFFVFNGILGLAIRTDLAWFCGLLVLTGLGIRWGYILIRNRINRG